MSILMIDREFHHPGGDPVGHLARSSGGLSPYPFSVIEPDERGLMPLELARTVLAGKDTVADPGGPTSIKPQIAVAALLSLADADEFVATVIPLTWGLNAFLSVDHLTALHGRYGNGVLPWIASRIDADGILSDNPPGLWWLLERCESPDAFDLAARIRGIGPVGGYVSWHPTGEERGPLATWILARSEVGVPMLARRLATAPDDLTVAALRSLLRADPRGVRTRVRAALGAIDLPGDLLAGDGPALPASVRAALDAAPVVDLPPSTPIMIEEYDAYSKQRHSLNWLDHEAFVTAMRVTGYVTPGGTDGLVFEVFMVGRGRVEPEQYVDVDLHRFGFGQPPGPHPHVYRRILDTDAAAEQAAGTEPLPPPFDGLTPVERLAYRMDADSHFLDGADLAAFADLPAAAVPLFTLDSWTHPVEKRTESVDFTLMVEALRERRAITASLTGRTRADHLRDRMMVYDDPEAFLVEWEARKRQNDAW